MGGFFYASKKNGVETGRLVDDSRTIFASSGFLAPITFDSDCCVIDYYRKLHDYPANNLVTFTNGDFIIAVGTFIFRGLVGEDALKVFFHEQDPAAELGRSRGHFVLILRKNGRTQLLRDPLGAYDVFLTHNDLCATSSFLAASTAAPRRSINIQETYEYVFNGVSLGTATPFAEVRRLDLNEYMILDPEPALLRRSINSTPEVRRGTFGDLVEENLQVLLSYGSELRNLFGDNIRLALSGGYDTRLLLSLFRRCGVTPHLFVYGSEADPDVRLAKHIAAGEGLKLRHTDKALLRAVTPEAYSETVQANFFHDDALPYGGIFTNGAELFARSERNVAGALHVNGGGGEIFRNFFNLLERSVSTREFVWIFYSQFDPAQCTSKFEAKVYEDHISDKIRELLALRGERLSRRQVEYLYPYLRCRSWFGRENSINNRWGYSVLPFFDFQTVIEAIRIPIRYKHFGNFESAMIRRADPKLSAYVSNYGHDFTRDAPLRRVIGDLLTYLRPPWIRRYAFRAKSWLNKPPPRPALLSELYLKQVIDLRFPYMSRYFSIDQVRSNEQYARICTLEYLYNRVSAL